jgi:hypothetical protein
MFALLFILTYFGILYLGIIEFLEKCDHFPPWSVRSIDLGSQNTS